mmetsp:Transcript_42976/g.69735  ORF Transcript_42976/g.69735 Transcript_42976/m.69735 type:complete len:310 (-) Transcript_42976:79-1008(-)
MELLGVDGVGLSSSAVASPYRVAFQGEPGAYSEGAAIDIFGPHAITIPCVSFDKVFDAVESGAADRGVLPIENSLAGTIHHNYDLLLKRNLHIIGEYDFAVRHCLLVLDNVDLKDVKKVLSHPMALAQCEGYLTKLGAHREATYDTAGSAKRLRDENMRDAAAIASARAGRLYALKVLAENIEDDPKNFTRFLVLSREAVVPPPGKPSKTSIVFSLKNMPGALFKALSVFALRDIDLTKIESRPSKPGTIVTGGTSQGHIEQVKRWEYLFYLDFAANASDDVARNALRHLGEIASFMRVLGSYPMHVSE